MGEIARSHHTDAGGRQNIGYAQDFFVVFKGTLVTTYKN